MNFESALNKVFKAYDVRGVAGEELSEEIAEAVGFGFGEFVDAEEIVVGRDVRLSSPSLSAAFIRGLAQAHKGAVDIGLCSTDMLYFASGKMNLPGAMFTASHNPPDYNGIKLCGRGASPIGVETGLLQIKQQALSYLQGQRKDGMAPRVRTAEVLEDFAEHVRSFVAQEKLKPLKVVADCANGMGALVVPAVFSKLPFDLDVLFGELDGTFPNHPADPIQPENLRFLIEEVRKIGADVGLAFDGDADRVFIVDDQGKPLSGSTTTAIVAKYMLERHPGATILHNVICSRAVPEVVRECGGTPVVTRVGHSFIKDVMARTGAVFGGEHSGHYYFLDNFRADSGIIAALIVLAEVCRQDRPLSEVRKPFERYFSSGEINKKVDDPLSVCEALAGALKQKGVDVDRLDGVSADMGDFWFNVRPSNTEPLLRINVEALSEGALAEGISYVEQLLSSLSRGGEGSGN